MKIGSAHRVHASTEGVTHYLPGVAGFLMEKEITFLVAVLERPVATIVGGAKVSDKIDMVERFISIAAAEWCLGPFLHAWACSFPPLLRYVTCFLV